MKKILYVSAFPPNNLSAGQHYSLQLLRLLAQQFSVDLIYWNFKKHSSLDIPNINSITIAPNSRLRMWRNLFIIPLFPLFSKRFSVRIARFIRRNAHLYDCIYFDFSQTFVFAPFCRHQCKIFMAHDVILQKYSRRNLPSLLCRWIAASEKFLLRHAEHIFTFSQKDSQFIRLNYQLEAQNVSFFISDKIRNLDLSNLQIQNFFVMFGAWNRPENFEGLAWLCDNIRSFPAKILIIGPDLPDDLCRRIRLRDDMEYLGFVDNPYALIAQAKALVAPLFQGAGVKVKVIEALALGTPVIGTDIAFEGIDQISLSHHVLNALNTAGSPQDFCRLMNCALEISIDDKISLRNTFLDSYGKNNFINCLKSFLI